MLEFEVFPQEGLRNEHIDIRLGLPICLVIKALQRLSSLVKGVELLYHQENPFQNVVEIVMTHSGLKLVFDSATQRLKLIEVYDLPKVALKYCNQVFCSLTEKPTIDRINECFGATHPGVYDTSQEMYILTWRGLSFLFPAVGSQQELQQDYVHGLGSLRLRDGANATFAASKMCIYASSSMSENVVPEIPLLCYFGNVLLSKLDILRTDDRTTGVSLDLMFEGMGSGRVSAQLSGRTSRKVLRFGDTRADVLAALGSAPRVFYKAEDKMRIHSGERAAGRGAAAGSSNEGRVKSDCFLNYFTLGLDVMLDADTNRVKKFVIHNNVPGHYGFGIYSRCNFSLKLRQKPEPSLIGSIDGITLDDRQHEYLVIGPDTKWPRIQHVIQESVLLGSDLSTLPFGPSESSVRSLSNQPLAAHPVILNRTPSQPNTPNPFGATFCYGYQDVVFEVMTNDHIASIILYKS